MRRLLRAERRALSVQQQRAAAKLFLENIRASIGFSAIRRVAVYLSQDGELDLMPFIRFCWQRNIAVYVPILQPLKPRLWFAPYQAHAALGRNRFGIPEPLDGRRVRPWQIDLVLLPLVGFDRQGGRLGMGGGYYDRTFAGQAYWPRRPMMIGVAHECQQVASIPRAGWDLALDGVVTDQVQYGPYS